MIELCLLGFATIVGATTDYNGPTGTPIPACPSSITARIGTSAGNWCAIEPDGASCRFPNTTTIHLTLVRCSVVETMDVWFEVGGCTGPEVDRWNLPVEHLQDGQRYPPLKSLKLDGYSFGGLWERYEDDTVDPRDVTDLKLYDDEWDRYESWDPNEYVDQRNARVKEEWEQDGEARTNLDMWIEAMDWSQLEELSINTARSEMVEVASKLPQRLTSLKILHVNSLLFIQELVPHTIEKLRWIGRTKIGQLEQILKPHSNSLKSVEYRCDEASCSDWPQQVNISAVADLAPGLQHISVNMPRVNSTWPLKEIETLAKMQSLTSADLYFRLQSDCELYGQYLGDCFRCGNAYREWKEENWKTGHCLGEQRYASPYLNAKTV